MKNVWPHILDVTLVLLQAASVVSIFIIYSAQPTYGVLFLILALFIRDLIQVYRRQAAAKAEDEYRTKLAIRLMESYKRNK